MDWKKIHDTSTVVDWHNHAALKRSLFNRNLGSKKKKFLSGLYERVTWPLSKRNTFPQMEEGGMDVILSTNYIPEQEWEEDITIIRLLVSLYSELRQNIFDPTYFNATLNMMNAMEDEIKKYNDYKKNEAKQIKLAITPEELKTNLEDKSIINIVHSVEGAHSLHGELCGKKIDPEKEYDDHILDEMLDNLDELHRRGCAYLTLAHFYPNHVSYPIFPYPEKSVPKSKWKEMYGRWDMTKGLTPEGEEIVRRMLEIGMLVDITHCTPNGRKRVYEIVEEVGATECLIASHTGCYEINRDPMNLEDWEIRWFADHGCVAGIILMSYWLSPIDSGMALKYVEQSIHHITKIAGHDVASIGTDLDGFTDPPDEIVSIDQMPRLTKYLAATNHYKEEQLQKILGENALRLLLNGWKASVKED